MLITIRNPQTNRETAYETAYLTKEARRLCKPYGKMHAFNLQVIEGMCVRLNVSYTQPDGVQSFVTEAI